MATVEQQSTILEEIELQPQPAIRPRRSAPSAEDTSIRLPEPISESDDEPLDDPAGNVQPSPNGPDIDVPRPATTGQQSIQDSVKKWRAYWPSSDSTQNFMGIGVCALTIATVIYSRRADLSQIWQSWNEFVQTCQAANYSDPGCQSIRYKHLEPPPFSDKSLFAEPLGKAAHRQGPNVDRTKLVLVLVNVVLAICLLALLAWLFYHRDRITRPRQSDQLAVKVDTLESSVHHVAECFAQDSEHMTTLHQGSNSAEEVVKVLRSATQVREQVHSLQDLGIAFRGYSTRHQNCATLRGEGLVLRDTIESERRELHRSLKTMAPFFHFDYDQSRPQAVHFGKSDFEKLKATLNKCEEAEQNLQKVEYGLQEQELMMSRIAEQAIEALEKLDFVEHGVRTDDTLAVKYTSVHGSVDAEGRSIDPLLYDYHDKFGSAMVLQDRMPTRISDHHEEHAGSELGQDQDEIPEVSDDSYESSSQQERTAIEEELSPAEVAADEACQACQEAEIDLGLEDLSLADLGLSGKIDSIAWQPWLDTTAASQRNDTHPGGALLRTVPNTRSYSESALAGPPTAERVAKLVFSR